MQEINLQSTIWKQPGKAGLIWESVRGLIIPVTLIAGDYLATIFALETAAWFRSTGLPQEWSFPQFQELADVYQYVFMPLAVIFFMRFDHMYTRRLPLWQQTEKIFKVSVYAILLVLIVMYLTEASKNLSRLFFVMAWLLLFAYLSSIRYVIKKVLIYVGAWQIPVIIIGAGKTAELLVNAFSTDTGLGYKTVGIIDDNDISCRKFPQVQFLGAFETAAHAVQRTGIQNVIIAAPGIGREKLVALVYQLQPFVKNITFVPDLFGIPVGSLELDTLFDEKAVLLKVKNNLTSCYNRFLKRLFDIVATIVGGLCLLPVFLTIAVLIYIDSPGGVIFTHRRVGKNGKQFQCYKFQTMISNAQQVLEDHLASNADARAEWEQDFKLKNDPRVTAIGKFLRKTSLDEFPQLLNILKGEMSLVGPRPITRDEIERYGQYIDDYYLVRPGLTGLWQVSGRNDISYDNRVQMDSWYVRNWSLWLDVVMLLKTVKVVVRKEGAY